MLYPYPRLLVTLLACLFSISLFSQQKSFSKAYIQKQHKIINAAATKTTATDFFAVYNKEMGLTLHDEMRKQYSRNVNSRQQHIKYQQFHQDIPVYGSAYHLHIEDGKVQSANGFYLPKIDVNTVPQVSEEDAVAIAIQEMNAEIYSWEDPSFKEHETFGKKPIAELQIVGNKYPETSENYSLVYVVEVYSVEPLDKRQYFVDALSGNILFNLPLLKHVSVPATGVTKYYGEQMITVDSVGPDDYLLQDLERGDGVITLNAETGEVWANDDTYWDFTNADQDEVAIDGHYCATSFYDYLLNTFDWNGLGNNGEALQTRIHGGDFVNAFWDGSFATFGDGDCHRGPLTTMEVVAHEFAHGLTDYTSDLIYAGESGAINESMSDVFGKALEYQKDPSGFDWLIGESFIETPYVESFRSMENPNDREHPKFYKGLYWTDGGGVHTNSSIGNHWFYLLVEGKSGVTENGEAYNVQGIGMEKAMEIVFLTQSSYLMPNSTYPDYYEFSSMATDMLFGAASAEKTAVLEAWKAVGLPYTQSGDFFDLAVSFPGNSEFICGQDVFFNLVVTVSNLGNQPYNPAFGANVSLDGNYTIELDETILPGESMVYNIDDYLFLGSNDDKFVEARFEYLIDDNLSNDVDYYSVSTGAVDTDDLAVSYINIPQRNCEGDIETLRIRVSNACCTTINEGAAFTLTFDDPNSSFSWQDDFTVLFNLRPGRTIFYEREIELPPNIELYNVLLTYAPDAFLDNNVSQFEPGAKTTISNSYFTEVDDTEFEAFDIEGFTSDTYDLNGDIYFATSSFSTTPFTSICPDAAETVDVTFPSNQLTTCVDFSDWIIPEVSFDLIQFRTNQDLDFTELYDLTAITQVSWSSAAAEGESTFFGQQEGENVNNKVNLPEAFRGRLNIQFANRIGDIDADDFLDYDANLVDNIQITQLFTSTDGPDIEHFELFPNPGKGQYFINHESIPTEIQLITVQGKRLKNIPVEGIKQTMNLTDLPDGYYFLQVKYEDQQISTKPLVKLTR